MTCLRRPWSPEEDRIILSCYAKNTNWAEVAARHLPSRSPNSISSRYQSRYRSGKSVAEVHAELRDKTRRKRTSHRWMTVRSERNGTEWQAWGIEPPVGFVEVGL